jgi:hypothetical protein
MWIARGLCLDPVNTGVLKGTHRSAEKLADSRVSSTFIAVKVYYSSGGRSVRH